MSDTETKTDLGIFDLAGFDALASRMIRHLPHPLTIGLVGTLGAGKTTLVQAIARAAGIDASNVTSPTFTLLQTHRGSVVLHHLDAYRLADDDEFLELGVDELFEDPDAWTVVEWADRVTPVMPPDTLWIEIQLTPDEGFRSVHARANRADLNGAIQTIRQQCRSN